MNLSLRLNIPSAGISSPIKENQAVHVNHRPMIPLWKGFPNQLNARQFAATATAITTGGIPAAVIGATPGTIAFGLAASAGIALISRLWSPPTPLPSTNSHVFDFPEAKHQIEGHLTARLKHTPGTAFLEYLLKLRNDGQDTDADFTEFVTHYLLRRHLNPQETITVTLERLNNQIASKQFAEWLTYLDSTGLSNNICGVPMRSEIASLARFLNPVLVAA